MSTESKLPSEILQEQQLSPKPSLPPRPAQPAQPVQPAQPAQPVIPPKPDISSQIEKTNEENNMTSFWSKPSSGGYTRNHTSYVPRKLNFSSQSDICTGCKKPVYAAELALGAGNKYHKSCLKCCQCSKRLDSTNMVDRDFDLYCRGCYSKAFGPKVKYPISMFFYLTILGIRLR